MHSLYMRPVGVACLFFCQSMKEGRNGILFFPGTLELPPDANCDSLGVTWRGSNQPTRVTEGPGSKMGKGHVWLTQNSQQQQCSLQGTLRGYRRERRLLSAGVPH